MFSPTSAVRCFRCTRLLFVPVWATALLLLAPAAWAQPRPPRLSAEVNAATRAYEHAKQRLDRQWAAEQRRQREIYGRELERLKSELVRRLAAEQQRAAQAVDLPTANAIQELIDAVEEASEPPGAAEEEVREPRPAARRVVVPQGVWRMQILGMQPNGRFHALRTYVFEGETGSVRYLRVPPVSLRIQSGERLVMLHETGDFDVWNLLPDGRRYLLDLYEAGADQPSLTGVAYQE